MNEETLRRISVALGARSYEIMIGPGLMAEAGRLLRAVLPRARAAIISDENVAPLYLALLRESLAEAGISAAPIIVPAGEGSKSFPVFARCVEAVIDARLERGDAVIALGGGVVGDLAGFVAGVVRRGMHFVQVPTTLLAQVDSSVGGKTGINVAQGKNLVGVFHQPALVLADTTVLDSLPRRDFASGYAEVVKYGLINDAAFFAWLERNWREVFAGDPARREAIAVSCQAKASIVARDERESGERALLNLGHTFGHALEAATGYSALLLHGEAVAIGMALAHDFSARLGLMPGEDAARVRRHLEDVGLPADLCALRHKLPDAEGLLDLMLQDKKVSQGTLTLILSRGIGKAFIAPEIALDPLRLFLSEALQK